MKQIKDHSLFVPEFQKLLNSQEFINMNIEEEEEGEAVIRLKKSASSEKAEKRGRLLQTVNETAGILRKHPEAAKELHAIAGREGEEDREAILPS